jgi:hypothetical protein
MFEIKFDISDFERQAQRIGGALDQVPFALSQSLFEAATNTKNLLTQDTWPRHVHARNSSFLGWALGISSPSKSNLVVEIYDRRGFDFLKRLETGGIKQAKKGVNLAIPTSNVRIGARGVAKGQRPRDLSNSFVANIKGRGPAIFQRTPGKGKKNKRGKLKLMYVLKPSVQIGAMVPFEEDFAESMRNELRTSFASAMSRAMKSRR